MGERLREVAQQLAAAGIGLFGEQTQIVGVRVVVVGGEGACVGSGRAAPGLVQDRGAPAERGVG
ncbi:MAG: hypothetical protein ACRDST_18570 [Pseudonocardiaceae bacterium]